MPISPHDLATHMLNAGDERVLLQSPDLLFNRAPAIGDAVLADRQAKLVMIAPKFEARVCLGHSHFLVAQPAIGGIDVSLLREHGAGAMFDPLFDRTREEMPASAELRGSHEDPLVLVISAEVLLPGYGLGAWLVSRAIDMLLPSEQQGLVALYPSPLYKNPETLLEDAKRLANHWQAKLNVAPIPGAPGLFGQSTASPQWRSARDSLKGVSHTSVEVSREMLRGLGSLVFE